MPARQAREKGASFQPGKKLRPAKFPAPGKASMPRQDHSPPPLRPAPRLDGLARTITLRAESTGCSTEPRRNTDGASSVHAAIARGDSQVVREQVMSEAPGPAAELEDGRSGGEIQMRNQIGGGAVLVERLSILSNACLATDCSACSPELDRVIELARASEQLMPLSLSHAYHVLRCEVTGEIAPALTHGREAVAYAERTGQPFRANLRLPQPRARERPEPRMARCARDSGNCGDNRQRTSDFVTGRRRPRGDGGGAPRPR